jgi:beta-lactamase regulating signal transducer with metallopeptidase domain
MSATVGVLSVITVVLAVALLVQCLLLDSPAARHTVLLWALVAVGLVPLAYAVAASWGLQPVVRLPLHAMLPQLAGGSVATPSVVHSPNSTSSPVAAVPGTLLGNIWALGAILGLLRIAHGLIVARRWMRAATPLDDETSRVVLDRVREELGHPIPPVHGSRDARVPVTIGCFRSMVLVPQTLLEQLDQRQLLHVLVHECAHAVRHDPLVGLYQRVVASALWFHPLVFLTNRLLDGLRERLCDNYSLRSATPAAYTSTLLLVARSLTPMNQALPSAHLFRSRRQLEHRVAEILSPGRNVMVQLPTWKTAMIAVALLSAAFVLTCWAASPSPRELGHYLSHVVDFEIGATKLREGDQIVIEKVEGTSSKMEAGNVYVVQGTYRLASELRASLSVFVTGSGENNPTPIQKTQTMLVDQGEGRFSLIFYMWNNGKPHVSFYPAEGGSSFASVYFGTGESLLEHGWWKIIDKTSH